MIESQTGGAAVLLQDGRVLIAGGRHGHAWASDAAELYR